MPNRDDIMAVLRTIDDPEMPISIVDLGIVEDVQIDLSRDCTGADVRIDITPTFVGCPALDMIRGLVRDKIGQLAGVGEVEVNFINDPPWSVDRISDAGRARLKEHGVTVPERADACLSHQVETNATAISVPVTLQISAIRCPFCGSAATHLDSPFGPTRCRAIYYCDACRNSFEHMRRV